MTHQFLYDEEFEHEECNLFPLKNNIHPNTNTPSESKQIIRIKSLQEKRSLDVNIVVILDILIPNVLTKKGNGHLQCLSGYPKLPA